MGLMSTIGIDALGASQGMELAKQNQRRDDEWVRSQKRADMQDQVAQYGLEDLQQNRGDVSAMRSAAAGKASVGEAADAASTAALSRGNVDAAAKAKGVKVDDVIKDFQERQAKFMADIAPLQNRLQKTQLQG